MVKWRLFLLDLSEVKGKRLEPGRREVSIVRQTKYWLEGRMNMVVAAARQDTSNVMKCNVSW